jgi:hypothetical protein
MDTGLLRGPVKVYGAAGRLCRVLHLVGDDGETSLDPLFMCRERSICACGSALHYDRPSRDSVNVIVAPSGTTSHSTRCTGTPSKKERTEPFHLSDAFMLVSPFQRHETNHYREQSRTVVLLHGTESIGEAECLGKHNCVLL